MFSERELAYVAGQRLARIATVSADGQPDVAPVGFEFDGRAFYVGGVRMAATLKYRNARANPKVALVVDDLAALEPMTPRGVKLHGRATVVERDGYLGRGTYLRIAPERHWSWGIEAPAMTAGRPTIKRTDWQSRGGAP
jgi:pyridoxamine 5'-phosphate oxidase family protein